MSEPSASRTVVVTNEEGVHARAATMIAELARRFEAKVLLTKNSERVEATDVMQILLLGAGQGEQVLIEAVGTDAEEVLEALVRLFAENFNENTENTK